MRIYVASPYSAPDVEVRRARVRAAMTVAGELLAAGYQPFVPLLSHYWDEFLQEIHGESPPYERWIEWALQWVPQCDALLVLGDSPGVTREVREAHRFGIPVHLSPGTLPPPRRLVAVASIEQVQRLTRGG